MKKEIDKDFKCIIWNNWQLFVWLDKKHIIFEAADDDFDKIEIKILNMEDNYEILKDLVKELAKVYEN